MAVFEDDQRVPVDDEGLQDSQVENQHSNQINSSLSAYENRASIEEALRVLRVFTSFDALDTVFMRAMQTPRNSLIPNDWLRKVWVSIKFRYRGMEANPYSEERLMEEIETLFQNTSRPLKVSKTITADDYIDAFIGNNIRWETIALALQCVSIGMCFIKRRW